MIAAAKAWFAAWDAQQNPDAPRYSLARWLGDSAFEGDPPTGHVARHKRARGHVTAATTTAPINVRITAAGADAANGTYGIEMCVQSGRFENEVFERDIPVGSPELANLIATVGVADLAELNSTMTIFDSNLVITRQPDGSLLYAPAANDNHRAGAIGAAL
jgi:hypothetical protein